MHLTRKDGHWSWCWLMCYDTDDADTKIIKYKACQRCHHVGRTTGADVQLIERKTAAAQQPTTEEGTLTQNA